jgi:hypothetical protein
VIGVANSVPCFAIRLPNRAAQASISAFSALWKSSVCARWAFVNEPPETEAIELTAPFLPASVR